MARSIGKPEVILLSPRFLDAREMVPTLDELMRRPEIPEWLKIFPPPASPGGNPFPPVPIMPRSPPGPTWPYGPPYLGGTQTPPPSTGVSSKESVSSQKPGGLLGMMQRSGAFGSLDRQDMPAGGLVELLREYLLSNRERI